jgi:hypothetical protein
MKKKRADYENYINYIYMNLAGEGTNIAYIVEKKRKVKLSVTENPDPKSAVKFYEDIELEDGFLQPIPWNTLPRTSIYICGMNGSGKSRWIKNYLLEFKKLYPSYPIRLFSSKNTDIELDSIPNLKRIQLDETFVSNPLNYEDLSESMVIFDDIDGLKGALKKEIYHLRDIILQNGRSYKIHCISSNHDFCGREMKACLNESNIIVFFFHNFNKNMRYFLESYCGLEKREYDILKKNKSRATAYLKTIPHTFIQEKNAYTADGLREIADKIREEKRNKK